MSSLIFALDPKGAIGRMGNRKTSADKDGAFGTLVDSSMTGASIFTFRVPSEQAAADLIAGMELIEPGIADLRHSNWGAGLQAHLGQRKTMHF